MRPLHKKLVDQFFMMKSSLGIQVCGIYADRSSKDRVHLKPNTEMSASEITFLLSNKQ